MRTLLIVTALLLLSSISYSQNKFAFGQTRFQIHLLKEMSRTTAAYPSELILKTIPNEAWVVCYGFGDTLRNANNQWLKVFYDCLEGYVIASYLNFDEDERKAFEQFRNTAELERLQAAIEQAAYMNKQIYSRLMPFRLPA